MRVYTTVTRYFLILNRFNVRTYVGIWPHCVVRGLWHVLDPSQTSHCHETRGFRGSWHDVDKSPFATKASPREPNLGSRSKRHVQLTLHDHFSTSTNMPWLNMAHYTTLFFKHNLLEQCHLNGNTWLPLEHYTSGYPASNPNLLERWWGCHTLWISEKNLTISFDNTKTKKLIITSWQTSST